MRTRVLVIARLPTLRRVMVDTLEAAGYVAFGCDGIEGARSIVSSGAPDIAIVDDRLPDGSSADLVRFLRSQRTPSCSPVRVVAMCTWATLAELTTAGAHCTVWKPVADSALLGAVRWLEDVYGRGFDEGPPARA